MPEEGTPIYVFVRGSNGGSRHVGFGYMPKRRAGFERILAIMFNLFRNPFNTSSYMQIDAGPNEVGATDSNGTTSGDEQAAVNRLVFVTADGPALELKTSEAIPLQGQDAKTGEATEIVTPSGDDDTDTDTDTDSDTDSDNPTSSRGGSSGCDAGFGALALLAVAGALAARKVRK
ncbi:MAG: SYNERG-CTERM sorting domain-containing protein [Synergistaceae bacterium]|nr:SYNERG-CTERM sorting domain-containing protein [Synergistaceae bacterium]